MSKGKIKKTWADFIYNLEWYAGEIASLVVGIVGGILNWVVFALAIALLFGSYAAATALVGWVLAGLINYAFGGGTVAWYGVAGIWAFYTLILRGGIGWLFASVAQLYDGIIEQ